MYQLLCDFKKQHGHVRVPKGFTQDPELANWVRNQRLEHSNMQRGKKVSAKCVHVDETSRLLL